MTTRVRTVFRCSACGVDAPGWSGRCGGCGTWNSLIEEPVSLGRARVSDADGPTGPQPLGGIDASGAAPVPVGVAEFDRILAGGLVPGSVTLLSGPPGVGKSTLALQAAYGLASSQDPNPVLYLAAEETAAQIRRRADRLGLVGGNSLLVDGETSLDAIIQALNKHRPASLIVDSIQTIFDPALGSGPGTVTQVRECAQRLAEVARRSQMSLVLIGHVTKDGSIAGPRLLEHLVDTVVAFDPDGPHGLRLLRATKNRFGPTGELGVFSMDDRGLTGVEDAAGLFLADRCVGVPGSVVVPVVEGRRTLLAEVQALVRRRDGGRDNRISQGLDAKRVDLVLAVLEQHTGISGDVFVSMAGGMRTGETGVDLAVAVAVASAANGEPVDPSVVICGELGLAGEVRRVPALQQRLREAVRLGFTRAIIPRGLPDVQVSGIELCPVGNLAGALGAVGEPCQGSGGEHRHVRAVRAC